MYICLNEIELRQPHLCIIEIVSKIPFRSMNNFCISASIIFAKFNLHDFFFPPYQDKLKLC